MVRLVITDFSSIEDNQNFYSSYEQNSNLQKFFTIDSFKIQKVLLPKSTIYDEIYSLNLLSKKHLEKDQFLVYISDEDFFILFNHKTIYSSKINENYLVDDLIKSTLLTKHLVMISSSDQINKIHYVINSKFRASTEAILKENTKNLKGEIIAQSLGKVEELIKSQNELDCFKSFTYKNTYVASLFIFLFWFISSGLNLMTKEIFYKQSLDNVKSGLKVQNILLKKNKAKLNEKLKIYDDLTSCLITKANNDQ